MVLSVSMEGLVTPTEQFVKLLQSAEISRNAEILRAAELATEQDRQVDARFSMESLVVQVASDLAERLSYLAKHPKLPVFLGGCAVKVLQPAKAIGVDCLTQPVLETETEHLGNSSVRSYFQFGVNHHKGSLKGQTRHLEIFGVTEEMSSGERIRTSLYTVATGSAQYGCSGFVSGIELDEHIRNEQRKALAEYKEQNSWVDRFMIFKDYGSSWVVMKDSREKDPTTRDQSHKLEGQIERELLPRLNEIAEGPHPDALYYFPLGLINEANRLFGTKQR